MVGCLNIEPIAVNSPLVAKPVSRTRGKINSTVPRSSAVAQAALLKFFIATPMLAAHLCPLRVSDATQRHHGHSPWEQLVNVRREFCELTLVVLKHFIEWGLLVTVYETSEVANLASEQIFTG
jgi:hypothetical protein